MNALPRILVIDDDPELLLETSHCLQESGYSVLGTASGVEGLHMAVEHRPELVLVTTTLSDIPGSEFCQRLKTNLNLFDSLCVVLSTQSSSFEDITRLPPCADGVIVRPIPNYEFLSRIETFLRMQRYLLDQNTFQEQSILTAVVENTDTSVWAVDQRYRLLFANSVFREENRTGLGRQIALGESVLLEALPPTEREEWINYYDRALQGEQFHFERKRKYSATTLWNEYHCGPIISKDGYAIGAVIVAHNITERKQAEEVLQRRAEELAALQSNVLEITVQHKLPDLLQTIVERAVQLLGAKSGGLYLCDREQRKVRCVVSYNTPRDFTGTVLDYGEGAAGTVAETGEPLVVDDYRLWDKRADVYEEEQPFTALLCAPMLWQNRVTGVIHVLDDVEKRHFTEFDLALLMQFASHAAIAMENTRLFETAQKEISESKRVTEALVESETWFRTLADTTTTAIFIYQGEKIVYVNRVSVQLCGYTLEEFRNMRYWEIIHPDFQDLTRERGLARQEGAAIPEHYEVKIVRKDDQERWLDFNARQIRWHGQPAVIGTAFDITERKSAEEALRQSEARTRSILRV
ncbi:MAG: PAS domain S-box protein, partial [Anaerolineales bacterium]